MSLNSRVSDFEKKLFKTFDLSRSSVIILPLISSGGIDDLEFGAMNIFNVDHQSFMFIS